MCGIVGVAVADGRVEPKVLTGMRDVLAHRGPDDAGIWVSPDGVMGLAHQRLAILDLSEAACQPMADEAGRAHIVFNGEVYNFKQVHEYLEHMGYRFMTCSDTEVILNSYLQWGTECLSRLNGMFAFGIYDAGARQIFIARDRVGKKPLYYVNRPGYFAFASELKALLADRSQAYCIDPVGLNFYFTYGYVPGDRCILKDVHKLPPAHAMRYDLATGRTEIWRYWAPPFPSKEDGLPDKNALIDDLERLLFDSVRLRLISDVPLGVLLSGGLDSSLIVAAAAAQSSHPIRTFTVTFPGESRYDEAPYARRVAEHFGTEHCELEAKPAGLELLNEMAYPFDEPLADSSLLPTFLVAQLTRQHVTVALGGDGGDELFGGYGYYGVAERVAELWGWVPMCILGGVASAAARLPAGVKGRTYLTSLRRGFFQTAIYGTPYFDRTLRRRLFSDDMISALGDGFEAPERFKAEKWQYQRMDLDAMMYLDFLTYLPDDIMAKVDRASMNVALEVRAPWLDYRIVEFAFSKVPQVWKVEDGVTRKLQKALAERLFPRGVDFNRKQGFSIPLDRWLVGPWRSSVEGVLKEASAPYVDWDYTFRLWKGQQRGRSNGARLFALLMYELWWRMYGRQISIG